MLVEEFNFAKVDCDCEASADRIINCYTRYMIKKFNLRNFDHNLYITCPRYHEYHSHIMAVLLKANKSYFYKKNKLNYSYSNCKEIDILIKRYIFRKFKIKVYFKNDIQLGKDILYKNFKIDFFIFLMDLVTYLRPQNSKFKNQDIFLNDRSKNGILILCHDIQNAEKVYLNLPKKLSEFLENRGNKVNLILPFDVGLNLFEKISKFFILVKFILFKSKILSLFRLSNLHFITLEFYRQIYKKKLKSYLKRKNISLIINSFIDRRYEPIYFEAAKELKLKYYIYDYSLGYPLKKKEYMKYFLDTRKYGDIVFSNSIFRTEQYQISSNFLDNKPLILPHVSPQIDYVVNKKRKTKIISNDFTIGIVDNVFFNDYAINYNDLNTLVKLIVDHNNFNLRFVLQSKRGHLIKEFRKYGLIKNNYIKSEKGDFSPLNEVDIIISIGWQGHALMSASVFKKPLLFYSRLGYPYSNHCFSFNKSKNSKMNKLCNLLWLNENNFNDKFLGILKQEDEFIFVKEKSSEFLNEIGFYENKLEFYFQKYFQ